MPTPVTVVRQCLTQEAAQTLNLAVSISRNRSHAQTTSLHAISALLSPSSSSSLLREACTRTSSYSGQMQFKVLELCLGVSLDRLPKGKEEEPPVSNSLMAAIKRSQANQKRMPESLNVYQERERQQSSSVSMVKVDLQYLVLSILDDPVVSRVFGDAGFRTSDIKISILRPLHHLLRYSHYRGTPMFLSNLTDENFKRIGDVLMRLRRNPFLIGSCAKDALQSFCDIVERKKGGYLLPVEIYGLSVYHLAPDISKFVSNDYSEEIVKERFKEVDLMVEQCNGSGMIISYGDVEVFTGDNAISNCIVDELTRLLDFFGSRVRLIGAAATYEIFLKFLDRFSSIVNNWDLQLLPVTSLTPSLGEAHHKSSLMDSFVPFGGLFSTSSDLRSPLTGLKDCQSRCHLCNEKCEKELQGITKQVFISSVAEQFNSSPPLSQMTKWGTFRPLEAVKAIDEGIPWTDKVKVMQQKWDKICRHLHHDPQLTIKNLYRSSSQVHLITGHQVAEDTNKTICNPISITTIGSSNISACGNITSQPNNPLSGLPTELGQNFVSQMKRKTVTSHDLDLNVLVSTPFSNCSTGDGQKSPSSGTSVTADLCLQTRSPSPNTEKQSTYQLPGSHSASLCSFDLGNFKTTYDILSEKISWQEEAVSAISQAIARCRARNQKRCGTDVRGDIWLNFTGPDNFSKKKISVALVELLYGNKGNFIRVDLGSHDRDLEEYNVKFRGKNVVDHVAWELSRKPFSVVFLENIDEADLMVQNSLSKALRTGKFPDSHGREVSTRNTTFVATSTFSKSEKNHYFSEELSNIPEEFILSTKRRSLQMVITCSNDSIVSNTNKTLKRKLIGISEISKRAHKDTNIHLDLNLPPEGIELDEIHGGYEDNSKVWFEDFMDLMDETVVFRPFSFQKFSEKVTKEIKDFFYTVFASDIVFEVNTSVIDQILVAMYRSEKNEVEDWLKNVLIRGFIEAQRMYNPFSPCTVKLITRDGFDAEENNLGLSLPSRIIVE